MPFNRDWQAVSKSSRHGGHQAMPGPKQVFIVFLRREIGSKKKE